MVWILKDILLSGGVTRPWAGIGGLYASAALSDCILPQEPIVVGTRYIEKTLTNDFYPGVYRAYQIFMPIIFRVYARWTSLERKKAFKSGLKLKSFCIASGNWEPHIIPLENHPTWDYVALVLAYGETGDHSHVEDMWRLGRENPTSKYIEETRKISTADWDIEHARMYLDRVVKLSRMIIKGRRLMSAHELKRNSNRLDDEIGIAIGASGELLHFRKGHHRICLAKQLDIPKVVVAVNVVHTTWLRNSQGLTSRDIASLMRSENSSHLNDIIRNHVERFAAAPP